MEAHKKISVEKPGANPINILAPLNQVAQLIDAIRDSHPKADITITDATEEEVEQCKNSGKKCAVAFPKQLPTA